MSEFLKRYKIIITTKAPVHIGTGEILPKKEWIIKGKKAIIIDHKKLIDFAIRRNLINSLENFYTKSKVGLYKWFKENGVDNNTMINLKKYEVDIDKNIEKKDMKEILPCIKDLYGKPYIPGSSLKGAIRNVIVSYKISEENLLNSNIDEKIKVELSKRNSKVKNISKDILKDTLNVQLKEKYEKNIMSCIRISDSKPLKKEDLIVCQKEDLRLSKKHKKFPIYMECIKPDTKIEFDLSIDSEFIPDIDDKYIISAINSALNNFYNKHLINFYNMGQYKKDIIYLGANTGFHTKTIVKDIFDDQEEVVEVTSEILSYRAKKHNHEEDIELNCSPRTAKEVHFNKYYQMGACKIEIIPV